jgi:CPA2 family monovalent cation:H+ antiporter-2
MTLTGGMVVALVFGYISHLCRLSPIVGYLLAGYIVGPHSPGFVADQGIADQFAEVGVILLMFGVGLQFHLEELLRVRRIAIPGAIGQSLVATLLGVLLLGLEGQSWSSGLVFGLAISVASTVVLLRVLADNHDLHTPGGHIAVGWLVVEDLFTVLVLVLLPVLFGGTGGSSASIAWSLVVSVGKLGVLVAFTFIAGQRVVPWILSQVAATRSRELFTLAVLAIALGIAVGSAKLFGASMALGAFLAGMVVGRSEFSLRAATEALPMRDAFAVLFFVSVGMLFNPLALTTSPGLILGTLAIVLIGKPLAAFVIIALMKYPLRIGLVVAIALAQIGEFTFIVATLAKGLDLIDDRVTNALVAAAIVSISINPLLYRCIDPLERWLTPWFPRHVGTPSETSPEQPDSNDAPPTGSRYTVIVVGYGPVGQTVVRLLRANGLHPVLIELNLETARRLRESGLEAVYGDATHPDILRAAHAESAIALILSAAGMTGAAEIIRQAREVNPKLKVFARSAYLLEVDALRAAGADVVFSGEGEVALGMTEFLLRQLGATAEQIDRERDRIREELFGGTLPVMQTIATALRGTSKADRGG